MLLETTLGVHSLSSYLLELPNISSLSEEKAQPRPFQKAAEIYWDTKCT